MITSIEEIGNTDVACKGEKPTDASAISMLGLEMEERRTIIGKRCELDCSYS